MGLLRLRFAAGVGVLAASLLIGSAAVAVADPDSSSSAANGAERFRPAIFHRCEKAEEGREERRHRHQGRQERRHGQGRQERPGLAAAVSNPVAAVTDAVAPVTHAVAPVSNAVAPVSNAVAPVTHAVAPVTNAVAPVTEWGGAGYRWGGAGTDGVAPVPDGVALASDVIALMQDMLTSVAGAVVPLTQLQSDLSSFLLGIAGAEPVVAGLGGRCWAVGGRGCVGGVAIAAGPTTCRCPGRAGGRQRNRDCNALGGCAVHFRRDEPGRSSVIAAGDGTASAQWRHSDGCAVVFAACRANSRSR